ncbi:unnamed protein product [Ectocarpus sp. 12 AP-2014]
MTCCNSEKKTNSSSPSVSPLLRSALLLLLLLSPSAIAVTYDVSADGDGFDLYEAMDLAEAGDTVHLLDGIYNSAVVSVRDGEFGSPITVAGGPGAIIKGSYGLRSVLITHSFITLKGFSVEGKIGKSDTDEASWVNKCVYVEGPGPQSSDILDGFVMEDMNVQNCGGECVRLKDSVTNARVTGSTISNCGVHDFLFDSGDKNGEGVYIGTSSTQWKNGEDACNGNLVSGNRISTSGNECIDIKEGSSGNTIENNFCSDQLDVNSGCYDSRGDGNTFRYNVGTNCMGAGVRLGGWKVNGHQYGVGNSVYDNDFKTVGHGALKVLVGEQGIICGNTCEDGSCKLTGLALSGITTSWDHACDGIATTISTSSSSPSSSSSSSTAMTSSGSSGGRGSGDGSASSESDDDDGVVTKLAEIDDNDDDGFGVVMPLSEDDDKAQDSDDDDFRVSADDDSNEYTDNKDDFGKDSDDYGNDYGDDVLSDDDVNDDSDDYGNDYGDDFDSDDESTRRDRRRLRGGAARAS